MDTDRPDPDLGTSGWPAIGFEEQDWVLSETAVLSRTQRRKHTGSYQSAVVPHIASVDQLPLSPETLALVDDATAAIVRFDAGFGAELLPFASLLLRSESSASSRIENLTASARSIALAELGDTRRQNGAIIVANTRAMTAAIGLADKLDGQAILDTHRALLEASRPEIVGKWRTQPVWIGGTVFGPHRADFVPPDQAHVPSLIDDLVAFIDREDLPVLIQAALAHAQFETIHPFPDGNGRTGRALVHAMLRGKGLTQTVTVPVSAGLLSEVSDYFAALDAYRKGEPTAIVESFATASFRAISNGEVLVKELRELRSSWSDSVTARADSAVWGIADLLLKQPIIDGSLASGEIGIAPNNALRAIGRLVESGVLTEITGHGRQRKWAAPAVLSALDDFAERAGRRG